MSEIIGIGTDIVEITRIRDAALRHKERFLKRLFTDQEQEYCNHFANPYPHYAGRFAAKEAIFKALSTELQKKIGWHDVEIVSHSSGKPEVRFSPALKGNLHILLSISHCIEYATATAILIIK